MREDCGFGKAKEMPRVGIGSVPDLVDNGNAFKTMDALRKQEKELRGKIDTMEVIIVKMLPEKMMLFPAYMS